MYQGYLRIYEILSHVMQDGIQYLCEDKIQESMYNVDVTKSIAFQLDQSLKLVIYEKKIELSSVVFEFIRLYDRVHVSLNDKEAAKLVFFSFKDHIMMSLQNTDLVDIRFHSDMMKTLLMFVKRSGQWANELASRPKSLDAVFTFFKESLDLELQQNALKVLLHCKIWRKLKDVDHQRWCSLYGLNSHEFIEWFSKIDLMKDIDGLFDGKSDWSRVCLNDESKVCISICESNSNTLNSRMLINPVKLWCNVSVNGFFHFSLINHPQRPLEAWIWFGDVADTSFDASSGLFELKMNTSLTFGLIISPEPTTLQLCIAKDMRQQFEILWRRFVSIIRDKQVLELIPSYLTHDLTFSLKQTSETRNDDHIDELNDTIKTDEEEIPSVVSDIGIDSWITPITESDEDDLSESENTTDSINVTDKSFLEKKRKWRDLWKKENTLKRRFVRFFNIRENIFEYLEQYPVERDQFEKDVSIWKDIAHQMDCFLPQLYPYSHHVSRMNTFTFHEVLCMISRFKVNIIDDGEKSPLRVSTEEFKDAPEPKKLGIGSKFREYQLEKAQILSESLNNTGDSLVYGFVNVLNGESPYHGKMATKERPFTHTHSIHTLADQFPDTMTLAQIQKTDFYKMNKETFKFQSGHVLGRNQPLVTVQFASFEGDKDGCNGEHLLSHLFDDYGPTTDSYADVKHLPLGMLVGGGFSMIDRLEKREFQMNGTAKTLVEDGFQGNAIEFLKEICSKYPMHNYRILRNSYRDIGNDKRVFRVGFKILARFRDNVDTTIDSTQKKLFSHWYDQKGAESDHLFRVHEIRELWTQKEAQSIVPILKESSEFMKTKGFTLATLKQFEELSKHNHLLDATTFAKRTGTSFRGFMEKHLDVYYRHCHDKDPIGWADFIRGMPITLIGDRDNQTTLTEMEINSVNTRFLHDIDNLVVKCATISEAIQVVLISLGFQETSLSQGMIRSLSQIGGEIRSAWDEARERFGNTARQIKRIPWHKDEDKLLEQLLKEIMESKIERYAVSQFRTRKRIDSSLWEHMADLFEENKSSKNINTRNAYGLYQRAHKISGDLLKKEQYTYQRPKN